MAFCSSCGTELAPGARFCGNCGASAEGTAASTAPDADRSAQQAYAPPPVSAPGRGPTALLLPALVVVALLAVAYLLLFPRSGARETQVADRTATATEGSAAGSDAQAGAADTSAPAPATQAGATASAPYTSAAVMDSAFSSNPPAAAIRYAGPVRVSGVIATMVQPGPTPSVSLEGRTRFNFVIANFPDGYREQLAPLMKGQTITVSCAGAKSLGGTTILSGCLLA